VHIPKYTKPLTAEMVDEAQRMMNENPLLMAKDKILVTLTGGPSEEQVRDAEKILSLENGTALV
jgi:hypothetical protein